MDFKKKIRHFFTLRRNAEDGFTLIELIVVIAIVAVLGGVAVPAYTGYIEKADAAADAQIIADINKAFAAACMVEGLDNYNANGSTASVDAGKITNVTVPGADADFFNTFKSFFDNEGEFKKTTRLQYEAARGGFVDPDAEGGNGFDAATIERLKQLLNNSSYDGNLEIITEQVGDLTGALSNYLEGNFATLGGSGFADYLTELGIAADDYDAQAEAAILYLAQNAANMSETDIAGAADTMNTLMETILVGGDQAAIVNQLTEKTGSSLASYAAIYAVAEGIALQQGEGSAAYEALHGESVNMTDAQSVLTALGNVLNAAGTDGVTEYATNGGTSSDLTAYFNALQAVNGQQGQLETTVKEGNSVVSSTVIQDLISQVGGK